jgi:hypothetical protein
MRMSKLPVTALGSWFVGTLSAFLVWIYIYSRGGQAAQDATYPRLLGSVVLVGGLAGLGLSLWVGLMFRRPAPGFLAAAHAVAAMLGVVGGSVDWTLGLWGYFGAFGAFAFLALLQRRKRRAGSHVHRNDSGEVSGDSSDVSELFDGDGDGGGGGGDGGGDGGGGGD